MQINKNPKLMIMLLVVAMVGGMLFSIVWPIFWPALQAHLVLGSLQPPSNASDAAKDEYYKRTLQKAVDNKLSTETIVRAASNYANWLNFDYRNYPEAKKAYDKLHELSDFKGSSGIVRTIDADGQISYGYIDHRLYLLKQGKPPNLQNALDAQKKQIDAAREMGYTNDVNDIPRQQRTLEAIATFSCDNGKYADALKYVDQEIATFTKNSPAAYGKASAQILKARALSGLGKTAEADKLFAEAVKQCDTAYGGGSDGSEWCLHNYSAGLIADGQLERGNKVRQQQDDLTIW